MRKRTTCYELTLVLLITLLLTARCASVEGALSDPVVKHCAAQTIGGAVIGGVAATTLADSKVSKRAAAALGTAAGGTAAFLLCRRSFVQAQNLKQRIAELEAQQQQSDSTLIAGNSVPTAENGHASRGREKGAVLPDGETPRGPMPSEGGPVVENLEVVDNRAIRLDLNSSLTFAPSRAALQPAAYAYLDVLASSLKENTESSILILGHTDNVGDAETNKRLSKQRAERVGTYLAERGVDRQRLETEGLGESEPIAGNGTAEGRTKNRRVEVVIVPT